MSTKIDGEPIYCKTCGEKLPLERLVKCISCGNDVCNKSEGSHCISECEVCGQDMCTDCLTYSRCGYCIDSAKSVKDHWHRIHFARLQKENPNPVPLCQNERHTVSSVERFVTKNSVREAWNIIPPHSQRGIGAFRTLWVQNVIREEVDEKMVYRKLSEYYNSREGRGQFARKPATLISDEFWNEPKEAWDN